MTRNSGRLTKNERRALGHFSKGPAECPKGIGPVMISNLIYHRWIIRVAREYDFGPERYRTTPAGDAALVADQAVENSN